MFSSSITAAPRRTVNTHPQSGGMVLVHQLHRNNHLFFFFYLLLFSTMCPSEDPQIPKTPHCCCPSLCVLLSREAATTGVDGALFARQEKNKQKKKKQMLFFLLLDFSSRKPQTKLEKKKNQERRGRLWALSVSLRHPSHPSHLFCLLLIWRVWSSNFQMTSSMSQCFWKYQRRGHSTWTPPPQPLHPFAHAGTVTPLVVAFIRVTWEESPV